MPVIITLEAIFRGTWVDSFYLNSSINQLYWEFKNIFKQLLVQTLTDHVPLNGWFLVAQTINLLWEYNINDQWISHGPNQSDQSKSDGSSKHPQIVIEVDSKFILDWVIVWVIIPYWICHIPGCRVRGNIMVSVVFWFRHDDCFLSLVRFVSVFQLNNAQKIYPKDHNVNWYQHLKIKVFMGFLA